MLEALGVFFILLALFIGGRYSMDSEWQNACKDNRPIVIESDVYHCQKENR